MIPVVQTRTGGPDVPEAERGNCFAACLASILECSLEDLPNESFAHPNLDVWGEWFKERGIGYVCVVPHEDDPVNTGWPGYTIGSVPSAFGPWRHTVVCLDGKPVWNPRAEDRRPLDALEVEDYYLIYVLDPRWWFQMRSATDDGSYSVDLKFPYPHEYAHGSNG